MLLHTCQSPTTNTNRIQWETYFVGEPPVVFTLDLIALLGSAYNSPVLTKFSQVFLIKTFSFLMIKISIVINCHHIPQWGILIIIWGAHNSPVLSCQNNHLSFLSTHITSCMAKFTSNFVVIIFLSSWSSHIKRIIQTCWQLQELQSFNHLSPTWWEFPLWSLKKLFLIHNPNDCWNFVQIRWLSWFLCCPSTTKPSTATNNKQ